MMEINSFKDIVILFGPMIALLLITGKLVERGHRTQRLFMVLILVDIGLYQLISYFLYCLPDKNSFLSSQMSLLHLQWASLLELIGFTLFLFHGPFHYAYCHSIVSPASPHPKRYWLHFLPGIVYACLYLLIININAVYSPNELLEHRIIYFLSVLASTISYITYSLICTKKTLPLVAAYPNNNLIYKIMIATYLFGSLFVSTWPFDAAFSLQLTEKARLATSLYLLVMFAISQQHPENMVILSNEDERKKYLKTQISGLDIQSVISALEVLMRKEKLYKEKTTLSELAHRLNVRPHQLSEILNSYMKTTFSAYFNDQRVEEAKRLLSGKSGMQIIEVSLEVGFSSLSVFYREFKKRTGVSPLEFIKRQNERD